MNLSKHISLKEGFTLIELLIVIGILGILAAGLLAALDPLDQLRRGRDTNRRRVTTELVGALNRYFAIAGSMPWGTGATSLVNLTSAQGNSLISTLVTAGELKSSFLNAVPAGVPLMMTGVVVGGGLEVYSCFDPESKAGDSDQSSLYSSTSPPISGGGCPATGVGMTCYFCAR